MKSNETPSKTMSNYGFLWSFPTKPIHHWYGATQTVMVHGLEKAAEHNQKSGTGHTVSTVLLKALVAWKCTAGIVHNVVCRWVTGFFVKNLMNLSSWKGLDSWSTLNGHSNLFQMEKKCVLQRLDQVAAYDFQAFWSPFQRRKIMSWDDSKSRYEVRYLSLRF